jgi:hypothetical protein
MNENEFDPQARSRKGKGRRSFGDAGMYLLRGEEQLIQSISIRAPLPQILNEICNALDFQISDVVSIVSLQAGDESELAEIAMNAALFGLHTFCSEEVFDEDGEALGSLEMYSCVLRNPSAGEVQLIERAKCLAAIAIKRHNESGQSSICGIIGNRSVRRRVLEWPVCMN